jgi:hypothetical protein
VVALLAIFAAMAWWARATASGAVGATATLDAPIGSEVVLSLVTVLRLGGPRAYVVGNATLEVPVIGPTAGLVRGEDVTVGGIVEAGHVRARWLEHAPDRRAKKGLGLLGLAASALIAAGSVRVAPGGLAIRTGAR